MEHIYDVVIIGGGPGGYTAALYCARAGLDTMIIEKLSAGGQMALTSQIDNYPGFDEGVDGFELGEKIGTFGYSVRKKPEKESKGSPEKRAGKKPEKQPKGKPEKRAGKNLEKQPKGKPEKRAGKKPEKQSQGKLEKRAGK